MVIMMKYNREKRRLAIAMRATMVLKRPWRPTENYMKLMLGSFMTTTTRMRMMMMMMMMMMNDGNDEDKGDDYPSWLFAVVNFMLPSAMILMMGSII